MSYRDDIKSFVQKSEQKYRPLTFVRETSDKHFIVSDNDIIITHSDEEMKSYVSRYLLLASKEIVCAVSPPQFLNPSTWLSILSHVDGEIPCSRISTLQEIERYGIEICKREITRHKVDLVFIDGVLLNQKFYVIDDTHVIFYNPGSELGEFELFGQIVPNIELAAHYKSEFLQLKKIALPARFVLAQLQKKKDEIMLSLLSTLSDSDAKWIESIFNFGVFSNTYFESDKKKEMLDKALKLNFFKQIKNRLVPNYGLIFEDLKLLWHETMEEQNYETRH